ncbi:trypsin-like peptidase domain-containing protein [Singulisphaera sp. Ch08]|uniref:Trypsin-like peptidase domain-containing protein n=1 Tax=Singulisphaera sp. Ch08 TaxID=3120278 RepID=A0AAU7CPI3_9BACT
MSRPSSPYVLLATLASGIILGVTFGRGGAFVSAQATGNARPESASGSSLASARPVNAKAKNEAELYEKLARQYELFAHVNRTFELVAEAVSPAVVHIVAQKSSRGDDASHARRFEETGSGVIVRADRGNDLYVLTNNHVVEGAQAEKIKIFLKDGTAIRPNRTWLDAKADIAVLGLGRDDLPAARLGDSDAAPVGTWVLALGSPFGLTHSVSQGIISARGRHMDELEDVENQDFLQTDAAINPGNSGGPLVNMKGEVIGINNSIASNGGGNEGVGFSIPMNLAHWIMNQLIANGRVTRGALGIDLHRETEYRTEDALSHGLDRTKGAWVSVVHQFSPAADAGLKDDDIILRFRGVEVQDLNHLINMVSMAPIGQPAELIVLRERKQIRLVVKVGERDRTVVQTGPIPDRSLPRGPLRRPVRPDSTSNYAMGLELSTLDDATSRRLGLPGNPQGAVVAKVEPDSPLAGVFKTNDIISKVDGQSIATADQAVKALNRSTDQKSLELEIDRLVEGMIERHSVSVP